MIGLVLVAGDVLEDKIGLSSTGLYWVMFKKAKLFFLSFLLSSEICRVSEEVYVLVLEDCVAMRSLIEERAVSHAWWNHFD